MKERSGSVESEARHGDPTRTDPDRDCLGRQAGHRRPADTNRDPAAEPAAHVDQAADAHSAERWVSGKGIDELLVDLRTYLTRLRDDPHNIQDRLRVAAIQLRLGRLDEALVHYEGVLRGYVGSGQILSAIALCERIMRICPPMPRLQRILAALYARAPRGSTNTESAVRPIPERESFLLEPRQAQSDVVVDRLFSGYAPEPRPADRHDLLQDLEGDDAQPTLRLARPSANGDRQAPIPLTRLKH